MSAYHTIFVAGFVRALIGSVVVVGLLPFFLVPHLTTDEPWRNRAAGALTVCAFLIGLVHLLVFAHLDDSVSFDVVLVSFILLRVWHDHFRASDRHLKNHIASVLRFMDSNSVKSIVGSARAKCAAVVSRLTPLQYAYALFLVAVLAMSAYIRLLPAWNHAAPFSVEYYETLRNVKELQVNQMYTDGYRVPLGLPIAAQVLSLFSQVNSALLLHFLGILSSIFLGASICYVVYRATFSLEGGIVAAALFGVFSGLLPLDLRHQVEADSLILATAFALPALSFFVEFLAEPDHVSLIVTIAGTVTAIAINLFVGCFTVTALILILVAALVHSVRLQWLRGMKLVITATITVLLGLGMYYFFRAGLRTGNLKNALEILFYDNHLNRYFSLYAGLSPVFVRVGFGLFGLVMFFSVFRYAHASTPLHLFSWGLTGTALLVLVPYSYNGIVSYIPYSQVTYILSIVLAVGAGLLVSVVGTGGARLLRRAHTRSWFGVSWKILVGTMALGFCWHISPPQAVHMQFTAEPDGFATSLYLIEQKFMPYQWTVVSNRGTALSAINRGRFLDYEYFVENYDPLSYKHGTKNAVPTPLLFFFVERAHRRTEIATELTTTDRDAEEKMDDWLRAYEQKNHDLKVFYSDEKVVVYEIAEPSVNALRG